MKTTLHRCILPILCVFTLTCLCSVDSLAQPANDACGSATVLTPGLTCSTTSGALKTGTGSATSTGGINAFCGNASSPDVWYSFVAQSTLPTIRLSNMGSNMDNAPRLQIFNTTSCSSGTLNSNSYGCASGTNVGTLNLTPSTALTIGNTYLVRVFTNGNSVSSGSASTWNFDICIIDAEANDLCANATTLTSSTVCTNTAGSVYAGTTSTTTVAAPDCSGGLAIYDVWYKFTAQTINPTITMSGIGAGFANPSLQLLSGTCGGTMTSLYCGSTVINADNLTVGTTYYIRVYSTTGPVPSNGLAGAFNICVTDPVPPVPPNDDCDGAITMPVFASGSCSTQLIGTMAGATASSPTALNSACGGGSAGYDVWYKFNAISSGTTTITLGSIGANFTTNRRLEAYTGSCGSLTYVACQAANSATNTFNLATTAGTIYYIRIASTSTTLPVANANFNICAYTSVAGSIRFGNSYVNVSKKASGGVVEPGDTLEIRMTINHTNGTLYNLRYVDNVPSKTSMLTGTNDSLRVITNEGLTFRKYSLAGSDDAGTYNPAPPAGEYQIRMNLGFASYPPGTPSDNTATSLGGATGRMTTGDKPKGGNGTLFATAYRVVVTGNIGDTIDINPGRFIYKTANGSGPDVTLNATPFKIIISEPLNLCANSIGVNIASEFGGTFGNGTALNRSTDLATPIAGYTFISNVSATNEVNDGRYAIVKNLSKRSDAITNARRQPSCNLPAALPANDPYNCNNRMFDGFWEIGGDHTGSNSAAGNPPPASNEAGGYMLVVNADYVASEVYEQTINNLCPNTYYEFSAWVKNVCHVCGIDSTGAQFAATATAPAGGYVGVYPNLTFSLNSVDYYSTGEIDTTGWLKKGFVFRTGINQTNAVFSIRNNSQGGGGNDWALDDIAVATCLPSMKYSPTINPNVCRTNPITIADTISSFFRNYTTYKWQRSTNGGTSWNDITGVTSIPDTNYYITSYTIPPANTLLTNNGDLYRVVVATTAANLTDPNCNISDGVTITLSVLDCGVPLKTDLLSFNGRLINDKGELAWTTSKEEGPVSFILERSSDGTSFTQLTRMNGYNNRSLDLNNYSFMDPTPVNGRVFYRLILNEASGTQKYSRVIQLTRQVQEPIGLVSVINPFSHSLEFDITAQADARIDAELLDMFGRPVRKASFLVRTGTNALSMHNTEMLPDGTYIFRIRNNEVLYIRKVVKRNF